MTDLVQLRGLRAVGICGVLPEEQARPQPIEVDLDLALDLAQAGASDDLADTVDYGAVCQMVVEVVTIGRYQLLEKLAERLAREVLKIEAVGEVTVWVRKLRPPVPQQLATSGVRITRRR